jgi:hypothetical protein
VHTPVNCDDSDACTTDTCAPATGCTHTPITGCGELLQDKGKMTGGGQFLYNGTGPGSVSFGFNARGTAGSTTDVSGHFNSVRLGTNEQINGPVVAIISVGVDTNGVTTTMTFDVFSKDGCTYRVTTTDNATPGKGADTIKIELSPSNLGSVCLASQTGSSGTTLTKGNIQGHKAQP